MVLNCLPVFFRLWPWPRTRCSTCLCSSWRKPTQRKLRSNPKVGTCYFILVENIVKKGTIPYVSMVAKCKYLSNWISFVLFQVPGSKSRIFLSSWAVWQLGAVSRFGNYWKDSLGSPLLKLELKTKILCYLFEEKPCLLHLISKALTNFQTLQLNLDLNLLKGQLAEIFDNFFLPPMTFFLRWKLIEPSVPSAYAFNTPNVVQFFQRKVENTFHHYSI